MDLVLADVLKARRAIAETISPTPLIPSPFLTHVSGQEFLLKMESMLPIGAFKLRGALNAVANLPEATTGVTCCSTGNHGRGLAYAARERGVRAVVCMSELVPQAKVDGIRALGGEVRIHGNSQDEAQTESTRLAVAEGLAEVSPFDDRYVIAGQGTIGLELLEARPDLATLLVPLSGGGLAGGIALAVKSINPRVRIVGVSMDRGAAMYESIQAGRLVDVEEVVSLADSLGGGLGADNRYSFDLCREHLDDLVLVSEEEIYRAMQTLYFEERIVAEGGSAVGVAALQSGKLDRLSGPVAAVISGRNVDMTLFSRVINGEDVVLGDYLIKGTPYGS